MFFYVVLHRKEHFLNAPYEVSIFEEKEMKREENACKMYLFLFVLKQCIYMVEDKMGIMR